MGKKQTGVGAKAAAKGFFAWIANKVGPMTLASAKLFFKNVDPMGKISKAGQALEIAVDLVLNATPMERAILVVGNPFELKERFIDNGNDTVTDTLTGLTWQRETVYWNQGKLVSNADEWPKAIQSCSSLSFAGLSGWHLPTIDELRTLIINCPTTTSGGACTVTNGCAPSCLIDECKGCSPSGGPGKNGYYISPLFDNENFLWSSSSRDADTAWIVGFFQGEVTYMKKSDEGEFLCVTGSL